MIYCSLILSPVWEIKETKENEQRDRLLSVTNSITTYVDVSRFGPNFLFVDVSWQSAIIFFVDVLKTFWDISEEQILHAWTLVYKLLMFKEESSTQTGCFFGRE